MTQPAADPLGPITTRAKITDRAELFGVCVEAFGGCPGVKVCAISEQAPDSALSNAIFPYQLQWRGTGKHRTNLASWGRHDNMRDTGLHHGPDVAPRLYVAARPCYLLKEPLRYLHDTGETTRGKKRFLVLLLVANKGFDTIDIGVGGITQQSTSSTELLMSVFCAPSALARGPYGASLGFGTCMTKVHSTANPAAFSPLAVVELAVNSGADLLYCGLSSATKEVVEFVNRWVNPFGPRAIRKPTAQHLRDLLGVLVGVPSMCETIVENGTFQHSMRISVPARTCSRLFGALIMLMQ